MHGAELVEPEWDALIDKFAISIVPAQRKQVFTDMLVHLSDNLQDMSIIWGVSVQFAAKRLVVPELNPTWTAEQWDVRSYERWAKTKIRRGLPIEIPCDPDWN